MTLLICEGFELGHLHHWGGATTHSYLNIYTRPHPSYPAVTHGNGIVRFSSDSYILDYPLKDDKRHETIIAGFNIWWNSSFPTSNQHYYSICYFSSDSGNTKDIKLSIGNNGRLNMYKDSTLIAEGVEPIIDSNAWTYIEVKATIGLTGTVAVHVNGAEYLTYSGDTTPSSGATVWDDFRITPENGSYDNFYLDDVYIANGIAGSVSDFVGPVKVEAIFPQDDGDIIELTGADGNSTSNWSELNDNHRNTGHIRNGNVYDYVQSDADLSVNNKFVVGSVANTKDLYKFSQVSDADTILGATVVALARKEGGGEKQFRLLAKSNGAEHQGDAYNLTDSYRGYTMVLENDPATSVQWTTSDIDGAQFGIEIL